MGSTTLSDETASISDLRSADARLGGGSCVMALPFLGEDSELAILEPARAGPSERGTSGGLVTLMDSSTGATAAASCRSDVARPCCGMEGNIWWVLALLRYCSLPQRLSLCLCLWAN